MFSEMSEIVVVIIIIIINDNNFAPSVFSHCVKSFFCFNALVFFLWELHFLRKIPRPKTTTSDFTQ